MAKWQEWSDGWIKEGHFISFFDENTHTFEHVLMRDLQHYEYDWHEIIPAHGQAGNPSGPVTPAFLEITRGYKKSTQTNMIWQLIFGQAGQVYIYIELPGNIHRHGIPKMTKPRTDHRRVSHFTEEMSPLREPTFLTEHFMMRPDVDRITLEAYNPNDTAMPVGRVILDFFINSMITERIGTVTNGELTPTSDRWTETLEKLYRRLIPCRPITLYPVQAPAEAQH